MVVKDEKTRRKKRTLEFEVFRTKEFGGVMSVGGGGKSTNRWNQCVRLGHQVGDPHGAEARETMTETYSWYRNPVFAVCLFIVSPPTLITLRPTRTRAKVWPPWSLLSPVPVPVLSMQQICNKKPLNEGLIKSPRNYGLSSPLSPSHALLGVAGVKWTFVDCIIYVKAKI